MNKPAETFHHVIPNPDNEADRRKVFIDNAQKLVAIMEQEPQKCVAVYTLILNEDGSEQVLMLAPPEATLRLGMALINAAFDLADVMKRTMEKVRATDNVEENSHLDALLRSFLDPDLPVV